jgi:hypothetical protein
MRPLMRVPLDILVVFAAPAPPSRATLVEHLYSIGRYFPGRTMYLNAAVPWAGLAAARLRPSLVVFHTSLLAQRWTPAYFRLLIRRLEPLKRPGPVKLMLPQDEFVASDQLVEFAEDFAVDHILSVAPSTEWPNIYGDVAASRTIRLHRVLTGYVDEASVSAYGTTRVGADRPIDIGYRAWHTEAWLGRRGKLKVEIAERVLASQAADGQRLDVSTRDQDTIHGPAWYRFLQQCRWTLGVEGGASILDRDGSLKDRVREYVAIHPNAGFDEIEARCFPGRDGTLNLVALSPRHLEACITRTAQILVEGDYNGVLQPHVHYLPVRADFSDLDEVLELARSDVVRDGLADRAYRDVVASGRYSYRTFVSELLELGGLEVQDGGRAWWSSTGLWSVRWFCAAFEKAEWIWLVLLGRSASVVRRALSRATVPRR